MSKYFSVVFTGGISSLNKFFETQDWSVETKTITPNKILIKVADELGDEFIFLKGTTIENEKGENTITSVESIKEAEFLNTVENGYEMIHHKDDIRKEPTEEPKKPVVEVKKEIITSVKEFSTPLVDSLNIQKNDVQEIGRAHV